MAGGEVAIAGGAGGGGWVVLVVGLFALRAERFGFQAVDFLETC